MNKKRRYMLNKILNQNADISYILFEKSSIAVEGRKDVQNFKRFIEGNYRNGKVLDLGCGPLAWPDYLPKTIYNPFGIDPKPSKFQGSFLQSVAEDLPFKSDFFDCVICATSLDHMLDVEKAISEISRTLKPHGRFLIWCNKDLPLKTKIKVGVKKALNYLQPRYWVGDNGYVFEVPRGAMDPFHIEYINPKKIKKMCTKSNMREILVEINGTDMFACFEKD